MHDLTIEFKGLPPESWRTAIFNGEPISVEIEGFCGQYVITELTITHADGVELCNYTTMKMKLHRWIR